MRFWLPGSLIGPLLLLSLPGRVSALGLDLSLYGGSSRTFDTRVELSQPGGTELAFDPVSWSGEPFETPIYYGIRFLVRPGTEPVAGWGFGVDFVHIKMYSDPDEGVEVQGTRDGRPVSGQEPLGDTFPSLSFSHGHNLLLAVAVHRWGIGEPDGSFRARLRPYAGGGLGVAIPHVEVTLADGSSTEEYQLSAPAVEGLAGLEVGVLSWLAAFLEGKLTYAHLRVDLAGGGELVTDPWTAQVAFGACLQWPGS